MVGLSPVLRIREPVGFVWSWPLVSMAALTNVPFKDGPESNSMRLLDLSGSS